MKFCFLRFVRVMKRFVGEKILSFLEFCLLSRMKQRLLLRQENSIYHQIRTRWTGSLSWWQWVQNLVRWREWVGKRIWIKWDHILHCWNQTQVLHYNIIQNTRAVQLHDSFESVKSEWRHFFLFSQSSWFMSNLLTCSRSLWRWMSFSKTLPNLIFTNVLISRNKFSLFALLWEVKFSRAPIKDATRWWGSGLRRKLGSSTRFWKKWIQISGHVSRSRLLYLCLGRSPVRHKSIQSRRLLNFWWIFVHPCT